MLTIIFSVLVIVFIIWGSRLLNKKKKEANLKTDNITKNKVKETPRHKKTTLEVKKNIPLIKTVKNNIPHVLFDRNIAVLKGNNYPLSLCINEKYGIIAISCNNGNIQIHKIYKDNVNKSIINKKMGEVYSCIDIDEEGNHLVAVDELTSTLRIFNIEKSENNIKNFSLILKGKTELHKKDVKFLYVHKNSYIITGSELDETEVKIWNMKGEIIKIISIKQIYNHDYAISTSGRFFGVACWSPGVKVFEIKLKENVFQNIEKVMDLKTNSGTKCICFSNDEEKAFIIDKHGILTAYNLNIRYKLQEDSKILYKKDLKEYNFEDFSRMSMSGDSKYLILISGCNLLILKQENLEMVNKIMDSHQCEIYNVRPIPNSSLFLTWANDGYIKLWNISKE
ncbi:conserved Plasmodium protein, unknown function [Plasmodium gallinaceum]|uniref:Uncharacterized protein n=1 Tax=Plasmodium gallinaceum TaxID=5849 RepID=A0A1J1GPU7_PLAGA|nr:conserved Plasmodium protein, unknown function [Plasmodium gallinaceum]CRG94318.1 conserved Plasmodium protein, unknown function [Plasmodium gallinaceum]